MRSEIWKIKAQRECLCLSQLAGIRSGSFENEYGLNVVSSEVPVYK